MFLTHLPSKTHGIFIKTPIPAGNLTRQEFFSLYKDQKYYFSTCIFFEREYDSQKNTFIQKRPNGMLESATPSRFYALFQHFLLCGQFF